MPTYEYACKDCGEHLEVVQSFRDDPLTECPHCGGRLGKVFSATGIIFKGSGWHIKDYAASGKPSSDKAAASSDAGSKPSDTKGGDADSSSKQSSKASSKTDSASSAASPSTKSA